MSCTATDSTQHAHDDQLIGEILDQRYAIVSRADSRMGYVAFDLEGLCKVQLRFIGDPMAGKPRYLVSLQTEGCEAPTRASTPPPLPADAVADEMIVAEATELAIDASLEAAWFAQGEGFEEEDPLEAAEGDYHQHQENLERLADSLPDEEISRYALG